MTWFYPGQPEVAFMLNCEGSVAEALAARAMRKRARLQDEWGIAVPLILQTVYTWLEDYESAEREAAALAAAAQKRSTPWDSTGL